MGDDMGKRSDFQRVERDFYQTPYEAVLPLLGHLKPETRFTEPCCGNGDLVNHLARHGHKCLYESDIAIFGDVVGHCRDALSITECHGDCFITNPPWSRHILHQLIPHLSDMAPTWLLFDADWMHTKQSIPFMPICRAIVSVGRVKWIPGSKMTGKDNAAWYLFDRRSDGAVAPVFFGRAA
jgi:hypothetical protein